MSKLLIHTTIYTLYIVCFTSVSIKAQLIPDGSLQKERTSIAPNQSTKGISSSVVTGGAVRGTTLFHSFKEFNVDFGKGVYFVSPGEVDNILARITGNNPSNIQGRLGVLGSSNLLLLNPNGILFGRDARLDLNGSFVATTASAFKMSDGTLFGAKEPQSTPLLTISVPIGLIFSPSTASIEVRGTGHTLSTTGLSSALYLGAGASTTGLRVKPNKNITFVGGDVNFEGGVVSAPSGQVNIGSVEVGEVKIENTSDQSFVLDYSNIKSFRNIQLSNLSLLDVSGIKAGNIYLQGKEISVTNGSYAFSQNQGIELAGKIIVNATDLVQLTGTKENVIFKSLTPSAQTRSGFIGQTFLGGGVDIYITTKDLILDSAGGISTITFDSGDTGKIIINASGNINLNKYSLLDPGNSLSVITSASYSIGNAKDILISASNLSVKNGSSISSISWGSGDTGSVSIDTKKSILVEGFNNISFVQSSISSNNLGDGSGGNVTISTRDLKILNNATISSLTLANGNAGNIVVRAEQITIDGFANGVVGFSELTSSARKLDPVLQSFLNTPIVPNGNAGSVEVEAGKLQVSNGGQVSVRNEGTGNAGNLIINSNSINLDNKAGITASTQSSNGGDIRIISQNLLLRDNSIISSETAGIGNGGNIDIKSSLLLAIPRENSDIVANAFKGRGGNISITAQGIFGFESRLRLTPLSDVTASSALGIDGKVEIDVLDTQIVSTTTLPQEIVQTPEITTTCQANSNRKASTFVNTGIGGIPPNPDDMLSGNSGWYDHSAIAQRENTLEEKSPVVPAQIIEAQGWRQNSDGTIVLTAEPTGAIALTAATKVGCNQASATKTDTNAKNRDR